MERRVAIELAGFSYKHPDSTGQALADITVSIHEGEFVVLAGTSGAGKSTLVRAIAGLAPAFDGGTAAGSIVVCGLNTRDNGPAGIARVCGTVLQDPERQVVMNTVRAELALPLESRGNGAASTARGVEEVALLLGIGDLLDRRLQDLSGGELQRVSIAAALAVRPAVLILDEPTSQLDPVAADDLAWTLRRLNEEQGITVVVAEQRLERLLPAADRVLALADGAIACDAGPEEFLRWGSAGAGSLSTPAARLFAATGLNDLPISVKEARASLARQGFTAVSPGPEETLALGRKRSRLAGRFSRKNPGADAALSISGLWDERPDGRAILKGIDLTLKPGEVIALMGRNGAGKSTLLRHAAGLLQPSRGSTAVSGRVAYLSQTPGAYLAGERLGDCVPMELLEEAGLAGLADRHPRDLSGGEVQRAALALVTASSPEVEPPAVVLLDEPTRGMDMGNAEGLLARISYHANQGAAVVVATHDPELAAAAAERTVLMGEGTLLVDAPSVDVLTGGWYFATETARILDGAAGALLPQQGADLLKSIGVGG
ncbi:MAG: ATP-binding cassette domain-containing protein [Actinomycetes bacterium]